MCIPEKLIHYQCKQCGQLALGAPISTAEKCPNCESRNWKKVKLPEHKTVILGKIERNKQLKETR